MKKLLALLLSVCFVLSFLSTVAFAEGEKNYTLKMNEELLENGQMEDDAEGYVRYGSGGEFEVSEDYGRTGSGMAIYDRTQKYDTVAYNVTDILSEAGPGKYKASMWIKLMEDSEYQGKVQLVLNFKTKKGTKTNYVATSMVELTNEWQEITFHKEVEYDVEDPIVIAYLYQQSYDENDNAPSVMVDDMSLIKTTEINGLLPEEKLDLQAVKLEHISPANYTRDEKTTFGAIRWDAWYTHDGKDGSVISQVERSLSKKEFHWRAPFFAKVTDEGNIIIPEYNQEIFDKEMEYAIEAGIDYFAYVWYDSDMKAARIFHTESKYRNDVKMCACLDGNAINKEYARKEMEALFKEDYYMTVLGGRPLMYYFGSNNNLLAISEDIAYYRSVTKALGIPEPYAVIMNVSPNSALSAYGDAVSSYAIYGEHNEPFTNVMQYAVNQWNDFQSSGAQFVPTVSYGWNPEPRFHNPVSWTSVTSDRWADYATPENITDHLTYAYSYMQHSFVKEFTKANTMIAYAWNEHDEGGWICPTIAVDEKGNQLYNEDGTPKINDERVKATRIAVDNYKNNTLIDVSINGILSDGSAAPTPTPELTQKATDAPEINIDENPKNSFNVMDYWWVLPIAVALIGAVVVIIIIKKRGK